MTQQTPAIFYRNVSKKLKASKTRQKLEYSDIQFLVDEIKGIIDELHDYDEAIREDINFCWEKCNPEDSQSINFFNELNRLKHLRRKLREKRIKFSQVQKKLKSLR